MRVPQAESRRGVEAEVGCADGKSEWAELEAEAQIAFFFFSFFLFSISLPLFPNSFLNFEFEFTLVPILFSIHVVEFRIPTLEI